MTNFKTADLCDAHTGVSVVQPVFRIYGNKTVFYGQIVTVKVFEDNILVRKVLGKDGDGKVLVVDGGGSLRCALLGDQLAAMAVSNKWSGIIIYGCIRDSSAINQMPIGVRALHTHPLKSNKEGNGNINIPVEFAGTLFNPGEFLYADEDGIVVSPHPLID
ncbi:MAG: putative 4-hydroxy-4-methyl-2-oxoglutarate aldolase [Chitinophagales bacterium]|nr:MAG: putative 4-hydroxy-4-methyl-2-oxoglutarate aldolase [Chitinophagales bacterium]